MTTEQQPTALRLASELDCHNASLDRKCAKELRRQHDEIEALKQAVPEGWMLVPVEPTQEMVRAAGASIYGSPYEKAVEWCKEEKFECSAYEGTEAYRAMLAAAPHPGE